MANGKAYDNMNICVEHLKWTGDRAQAWLLYAFTHALQHDFPTEWQEN